MFWTNDKTAIPRTVAWFASHGMQVRDTHDLPSYDAIIAQAMDEYTEFRFAAAADIIRLVILNDIGGLYMDIDASIQVWDD